MSGATGSVTTIPPVPGNPLRDSGEYLEWPDRASPWPDVPPTPDWVLEAQDAALREDLAAAAAPGPLDRDALTLLWLLDPVGLATEAHRADVHAGEAPAATASQATDARRAARTLLDGIVVAQRVVNYAQAVQQRLMAAFCRPGVAIPLSELMDMAGDDLSEALATAVDRVVLAGGAVPEPAGRATPGAATSRTPPADRDTTSLLEHPVWAPVLRDAAIRSASAEVACALHLAPVTARLRCENATELVDHLPATLAAQEAGDVDGFRARLILDRVAALPPELRHGVECRVLPRASSLTAASFKRLIDREVIAADPASAQRRLERAKARRNVISSRVEDGTGTFTAIVSASDAELAYRMLDAVASSLVSARLAGDRTRAQLRADAFTDLFRSLADTGHASVPPFAPPARSCPAPGGAPATTCPATAPALAVWCGEILPEGRLGSAVSIRRPVALNVYLDATTLAEIDSRPGELAGFGAITAQTARALAASADTIRAIIVRPGGTDRTCGTTLDAGRAVYRPPDRVADHVVTRDRTCCFPGCRMPASRCDLDHRQPFDSGGETCPCNLDALCRTHHRLKTFAGWSAGRDPATGLLTWTSPLGRRYASEQPHLLRESPLPNPAPDANDPPPF